MDAREKKRITSILVLALIVLGIVYVDWAKEHNVASAPEATDADVITSEEALEENNEVKEVAEVVSVPEVAEAPVVEPVAVTESIIGTQQYTNSALGFGMTIPDDWSVNKQSQPGKYTVRFEGAVGETDIFMNVWVHDVTIDVTNDPSGLLNGYTVFVNPKPVCPEEGGLCDVASMRIPYDTENMPRGGEWTTRVVEVIYGASLNGDLSAPKTPDTKIFEEVLKTFFFTR